MEKYIFSIIYPYITPSIYNYIYQWIFLKQIFFSLFLMTPSALTRLRVKDRCSCKSLNTVSSSEEGICEMWNLQEVLQVWILYIHMHTHRWKNIPFTK